MSHCVNLFHRLSFKLKQGPVIAVDGDTTICVGATSSLTPSVGGTWTSLNPDVATIDNTGIITGRSQGSATFILLMQFPVVLVTSLVFSVNDVHCRYKRCRLQFALASTALYFL